MLSSIWLSPNERTCKEKISNSRLPFNAWGAKRNGIFAISVECWRQLQCCHMHPSLSISFSVGALPSAKCHTQRCFPFNGNGNNAMIHFLSVAGNSDKPVIEEKKKCPLLFSLWVRKTSTTFIFIVYLLLLLLLFLLSLLWLTCTVHCVHVTHGGKLSSSGQVKRNKRKI